MGINWLGAVSYALDKIPFEKLLSRPREKSQDYKELIDVLKPLQKNTLLAVAEKPREINHLSFTGLQTEKPQEENPKVHLDRKPQSSSTVTTAETVAYQNREIGKILLQMERHASQRFRIAGRVCECGAQKHLLDIEALAEETIAMVDNPSIYNKILDFVKDLGPKCTVEAVQTGKYDSEYQAYSNTARDLRKELLGTLDAAALFPAKEPEEPPEEKTTEVSHAEEPIFDRE